MKVYIINFVSDLLKIVFVKELQEYLDTNKANFFLHLVFPLNAAMDNRTNRWGNCSTLW